MQYKYMQYGGYNGILYNSIVSKAYKWGSGGVKKGSHD